MSSSPASPVGDAIKLLVGGRESEFDHERALRWFQFKYWLLNDVKQTEKREKRSFGTTAMIYCALVIRQRTNDMKKKRPGMPASYYWREVARELDIKKLINLAFQKDRSAFSLAETNWLPFWTTDETEKYETDLK